MHGFLHFCFGESTFGPFVHVGSIRYSSVEMRPGSLNHFLVSGYCSIFGSYHLGVMESLDLHREYFSRIDQGEGKADFNFSRPCGVVLCTAS